MHFSTQPFGETLNGKKATLFSMSSPCGLEIDVTDYGARIVSLRIPDKQGIPADMVLGYDDVSGYDLGKRYFGSNPGPFANRIGGAAYSIDNTYYKLEANEGHNQLHGGSIGFDRRFWAYEWIADGIRFTERIPHGEAGRPGNLDVTIEYRVTEFRSLEIHFRAETDAPTHVNITHHGYFNLNGNPQIPVLNHHLQLHADSILQVDAEKIPTGHFLPVADSFFDFRETAVLGERIARRTDDYDHCYVLNENNQYAAWAYSPHSGIAMYVQTDYPGMQLYCSGKPAGTPAGKGGRIYPPYASFCLEPQFFPDSPNKPEFPTTLLRPGEVYNKRITLTFSLK